MSGELAHVDTKGLGRFAAIGHQIRGNHSEAASRTGLGKDHMNVAVDNATRVA